MISFRLVYQKDGKTQEVPVTHPVIPRVGEKVIPPNQAEATQLTVLTVEHDLDDGRIWVILN